MQGPPPSEPSGEFRRPLYAPPQVQKIHSETTFDDEIDASDTGEPATLSREEPEGTHRTRWIAAAGLFGTTVLAFAAATTLLVIAGLVWLGSDPLDGAATLLP